ncbi:MAG: glycosyl transferase [Lutibacter sp.]|nr:MAG: glycosyl transferase [Lutibacter sp.]
MILISHLNNKPIDVVKKGVKLNFKNGSLSSLLFEIAELYPSELIIWCHYDLQKSLNIESLSEIFQHSLIMASFSTSHTFVIPKTIGYVEQVSPFININFKVKYPTWRMSSDVGGINTDVINQIKNKVANDSDFDYFLNSIAKISMPNGLFCYSEPRLLQINSTVLEKKELSNFKLFKFVKQHYKLRWLLILNFNFLIYEKKLTAFPFLKALFLKNRTTKIDFNNIKITSTDSGAPKLMDVVIPTIGREKYLFDVLKDLNNQTIPPKNVIVIEQNTNKNAVSELDYLKNNTWNFVVKHEFIHQSGACNARNIALQKVDSNWVFFADDDIRIKPDFIEKSFDIINKLKADAITVSCLLENEVEINKFPFQWPAFGSGCSIVNIKNANKRKFDMGFEHGFGEDADFGMQLRNQGVDVIYVPSIKLLHLKAPMGGFRTKFIQQWEKESLQPKPSPTIMLYNEKYNSKEQLLGYKTLLFFKFYRIQDVKNPFKYLIMMKNRWEISKNWSKTLQNNTDEL